MNKTIIITGSEDQVKELHTITRVKFDNIGFWGQKQQDFDKKWIWVYDGKDLSGTSGFNSLENTISQNPGAKIYFHKDFMDSIYTQHKMGESQSFDTNMFDEMRAAGSSLPDMVEALRHAGWKTYQHHDNWVHKDYPQGLDTHQAFAKLSCVEKMKPEQNRFNKQMFEAQQNYKK